MVQVIQLPLDLDRGKIEIYCAVGLLYDAFLREQREIAVGRGLTKEFYTGLLNPKKPSR
mgnify:CR=1 FL=1